MAHDHLLRDTHCFFCEPEPWRTIAIGDSVNVIAGAGPLCPGYVMVAPAAHIHSVAELTPETLSVFLATCEVLKAALQTQFRPGYTAYEHGRTGACASLEHKDDLSTFCHHAHRVFVPHKTDLWDVVGPNFGRTVELAEEAGIRELAGQRYIYLESGTTSASKGKAFMEDSGLPSQFMRRVLTEHLPTGRPWNWQADYRLEEMAATIRVLHAELSGLLTTDFTVNCSTEESVRFPITIDGLAGAGKTTIGGALARRFDARLLDTGMYFRVTARAQLEGRLANFSELLQAATGHADGVLREDRVSRLAAQLAAQPDVRAKFAEFVADAVKNIARPILIGRDAWRSAPDGNRILVLADLETRARRSLLRKAVTTGSHGGSLASARVALASEEHSARQRLPSAENVSITVWNQRRSLDSTLAEICTQIN